MSQKILERAQVNSVAPANRVARPVLSAAAAVLPARLFLGIVFLYAGIDKLTNPEFFNPSSPGYIGNQLAGFATISPIGGFLTGVAVPNAALFGWLSALSEVAIGLGTLAGLFSRVAALGGMLLSLTLWLSASWATEPFYLGSDLPYAMFFLVLAVGGPHPVLSLDGQFARWRARRKAAENSQAAYQFNEVKQSEPLVTKEEAAVLARRRFLTVTGATLAAGTFGIVAWGNALAGRPSTTTTSSNTGQTSNSGNVTAPATAAAPTTAAGASGTVPATTAAAVEGTILTTLSALPAGSGKSFSTPDTNQPFLVIRGEGNTVHAFSAICTHQGCTVAFNQAANSIICPCHGAEYNPTTGAVTQGPAPRALAAINVTVDTSGNVIYTTK